MPSVDAIERLIPERRLYLDGKVVEPEQAARISEPEYTGHEAVDAGVHPDADDHDPPGPDSAGNRPSRVADWGPER